MIPGSHVAGAGLRVAVVGGGIAGAAVALALRRRSVEVTVVDRARQGSATAASAGMLAPLYEASEAGPLVRFGLRSLAAWPEFAGRIERLAGGGVGLRRAGMLVACRDEEETAGAEAVAAELRGEGLEAELLEPVDARRVEPAVGEAPAWLWLPREGQVDAQALAGLLPDALRGAGARLAGGTEAAGLVVQAGAVRGVALADGGRLPADRVVLAAGAWSPDLRGLPRTVPVRPLRGQILRYRPGPGGPRRLVADPDGGYVVPRNDGGALAGSTMEEAGFDPATTDEGLRGVREAAVRLVPGLADRPEAEAWAGLRPVTPDGLPLLGPDPEVEGLLYATGYGRNGILLAPVAGEELAALVLGEEPGTDLSPYRPDRFARA